MKTAYQKSKMSLVAALMVVSLNTFLSFGQNQPFTIIEDSIVLKSQNDALIKDIESRIKKVDTTFSFNGLKTIVQDSFPMGMYMFPPKNQILLPDWNTMPQFMNDFSMEVTGGKEQADELAAMYFYGFFLPHEIGHAFRWNTNTQDDNDYDNEKEANKFALLYWKELGKTKELDRCYDIAKTILSKLKNPIPENEDPKKYLTEHYEELSSDPNKYAYILFDQIVDLFETKELPDFDTYVKQVLEQKK